jgi:hypothetical protein
MRFGFTGTREGLTTDQRERLRDYLRSQDQGGEHEFHHGCCVGADAQAVGLASRGRHFVGIERDPGYYATAKGRFTESSGVGPGTLFAEPLAGSLLEGLS